MQLLLNLTLTVELQQPDGSLQHQKAIKACAGTVVPVAVGPHIGAGLQHVEEALNRILFPVEIVVKAQAGMLPSLSGNLREQITVDFFDIQ